MFNIRGIKTQYITVMAVVLMAIISIRVLFVAPVIGVADNGDAFREIHNIGIYHLSDNMDDKHFGYFNKRYGIQQYVMGKNTAFVSTLSLLIRFALIIDKIFTGDMIFDIRILGALYLLVFLGAFYLFFKYALRPLKRPIVIVAALLAMFVFGDVGYLAYFNSFYGEPASYVFLLFTLAMLFKILQKEYPSIFSFLGFVFCAMIFIGAKQQNSPIGFMIAVFSIRLLFLRKDKLWKFTGILAILAMMMLSAFTYLAITDDIEHINQYHALTRGILQGSQDPVKDTEELGLDSKFSVLADTTYYDQYTLEPVESPLMQEEFYPKYGFISIIKYYLRHQDRLYEKLSLAAKNGFSIRPNAMGNYEKSENKGYGKKTSEFSLWSSVKNKIFPKSFEFLMAFYLLFFGTLLKYYVKVWKEKSTRRRIQLEVFALMGVIGMAQFGISFIGAGDADMAKHLFLFNVCFDFMFYSASVFVANLFYTWMGVQHKGGVVRWNQKSSISG